MSGKLTIGRVLSSLIDSVKAVVRGGAKGATVEADVTSTSIDADHQALDVAVRASVAIPISGTVTVAEPVSVDDNGGSLTVDTPQLPAALVGGRLDENLGAWLGSTAPTVGQKTMSSSVPVVLASDQTAVSFTAQQAATSAVTNVAQSAASVTLLAANANRVEAVVYNDGTKDLFVKYGATASLTSFTLRLLKGGHVVVDRYTGIIDGIWSDAGGGAARVTELTP